MVIPNKIKFGHYRKFNAMLQHFQWTCPHHGNFRGARASRAPSLASRQTHSPISLLPAAHQADVVVDADDVTLRPAAVREIPRVAGFGITPLRSRAMNVEQLVCSGTA